MLYLIYRTDGGITEYDFPESFTEAQINAHIVKWDANPANKNRRVQSYKRVDPTSLPLERWRDAWKHDGTENLSVDLGKARSIRKRELLAERELLYKNLENNIAVEDEKTLPSPTRLRQLKDKRRLLRELDSTSLDVLLGQVTDLQTLSTYVPPIFNDADVVQKS